MDNYIFIITLKVAISNKDCLQNGGDSCKLDYEGTRSYVVKVLVTDSGHPSKSNTFDLSIEVTDANDPPRNIKLSGKNIITAKHVFKDSKNYKVEELAPKGTEIGKLTVDDQDRSQTHTFTLEKDGNGLFEVTSDGAVRTATDQRLDVTIVYEITVRATDSGTPQKQVEGTFSITATGVNEAPVSVTFTPENAPITFAENEPVVMENSPVDSVIGTVVAKDQDPDQALTFSVKAKTDVQYIKVDTSPDCTSEDLLFSSDKLEVNENLQGETIGIFQVIDPDDGDSHVFKLTNDGGGNFAIDNKGRLSTSAGSSLDYEATKSVDITVSVNDAKGLSFEKSYNVSILDVNEAPTKIVLTNNKVSTNSQNKDKAVTKLQ
ncbi:hypothetical protein KUTeg_013166 [Tegillarca granosa]|uniref:Cadherin domain-containing protein n=1 Tax=Tegillarca granosa TaxID=220873 RepID=A0ABQ9EXE6_TEGGR|nr:hypothetical protein KUTeg_013166 [Tegillarca granosa]